MTFSPFAPRSAIAGSLSFYQGKQAIGIDIVKQSGSNTVEVADGVKKEIEKITKNITINLFEEKK